MKTNFKTILVLFLSIVTLSLTSCKKEEEKDITVDVVNVYNGTLNVAGGYQSTDYSVTITKVDNTTIKITPEDNNATAFEVNLKEGSSGTIVSVDQSSTYSVVYANTAGIEMLTYTYTNSDDEAEEFTGTKQ